MALQVGRQLLDRRFDVAHGDVGAGLGEADGERPTQSPRRARDDRPSVVERTGAHRSVTGRFQHVCISPCCSDRSAGCAPAARRIFGAASSSMVDTRTTVSRVKRIPRAGAVLGDSRVDRRLAEAEGDAGAQPVGPVLPAWLPLAQVLALHEELVRVGERPRIAVGGRRRAHDQRAGRQAGARTARPRGGRSAAPTGPAWSDAAPRGRPSSPGAVRRPPPRAASGWVSSRNHRLASAPGSVSWSASSSVATTSSALPGVPSELDAGDRRHQVRPRVDSTAPRRAGGSTRRARRSPRRPACSATGSVWTPRCIATVAGGEPWTCRPQAGRGGGRAARSRTATPDPRSDRASPRAVIRPMSSSASRGACSSIAVGVGDEHGQ